MDKPLLSAGIAMLILASVVQFVVDLGGFETPRVLPDVLARRPPSEPAMALGVAGTAALVIGLFVELFVLSNPVPGGRVLVGLFATLGFLLIGGFVGD